MSTIEDRLSRAISMTAEQISPARISPLRLAPSRSMRRSPMRARDAGAPRLSHWQRRLAPATAAAAVLAVLGTSVAVSIEARHHAPAADQSIGSATFPLASAPAYDGGAVPAYYVTIPDSFDTSAQIRATATGALLATIRPPQPRMSFTAVTGAADDRTFVLAGQVLMPGAQRRRAKLFLLRLDPAAGTAKLRLLPISVATANRANLPELTQVGVALSPDGSRLAVAPGGQLTHPDGNYRDSQIQVYDLATGSEREWTWPGTGNMSTISNPAGQPLTWAADDRTLDFQINTESKGQYISTVRLLDTASPGSDLRASSSPVLVFPDGAEQANRTLTNGDATLTPDGTKIALATYQIGRYHQLHMHIAEFSAQTGTLVSGLDSWRFRGPGFGLSSKVAQSSPEAVLWANSTGSVLIVDAPYRPGANQRAWQRNSIPAQAGVLAGEVFTPLPGSQARALGWAISIAW